MVIFAVTSTSPSGSGWTMMFRADVPAAYSEPTSIGKFRFPPETVGGRVLSGRMIDQRLVSSESPSNSSERTLSCGHSRRSA